MVKASQKTLHAKLIRHLREWHRKTGIFAALLLIFLSISGIALNHTEGFKLGHIAITNQWLLQHYGIKDPSNTRYFQNKQFSVSDGYIFNGDILLQAGSESVIAIGRYSDFYLVLSQNTLALYDDTNALVDQITASDGLPIGIKAMIINTNKSTITLKSQTGYYQSGQNLLDWQKVDFITEPSWIKSDQVSSADIDAAKLRYKSQFLSLERIVLDAHSGRIFGDFMVLFMDIVALATIILSLSGLYIWIRYARAKR
ncbi:PepSY-associated TM helix domain-containing protein [Thalassotalea fonticola]|uniref:PepSY-associated TM helix domain-containing protein n=1 Tax=Thalassotalea fonticola TaxID=3065649 RepID=A0ABZ0GNL0_9GAMM|nr:PepSY-associated TM helix domain-containing protein [Colwelliaceae bacterium S1-1]